MYNFTKKIWIKYKICEDAVKSDSQGRSYWRWAFKQRRSLPRRQEWRRIRSGEIKAEPEKSWQVPEIVKYPVIFRAEREWRQGRKHRVEVKALEKNEKEF